RDGLEIADWIVSQTWSNGKGGAHGVSYEGSTAEFLVVNENPAVKASVPQCSLFDAYTDNAFPGGIRQSWFSKFWNDNNQILDRDDAQQIFRDAAWWARPFLHGVRPVDDDTDHSMLRRAIQEHGRNGNIDALLSEVTFRDDVSRVTGVSIDASSPFSFAKDIERSGATVYSWGGWFDGGYTDAVVKRFLTLKNRGRLILGPWNHTASQDASPFSPSSITAFDRYAELLRFFDDQLKEVKTGIMEEKPVLYFTMGEERWKGADSWPPPGTHLVPFYFGADHQLTTAKPSTSNAHDQYVVDESAGTGRTSRWDTLAAGGDV